MNRRDFLAGSAGLLLSMRAAHAEDIVGRKLRVGLIGCGWYGKVSLGHLMQIAPVDVVSLCDVDRDMLGNCASWVESHQASKKRPAVFADYRDMLKPRDLDVVLVATPDHWHALTAIAAMEAGADVYVEKPISVDVVEGQAMVATARRLKRVVQVNTQRRSTPHLVKAKDEIIGAGKLGHVGLVEIYSYVRMRPSDTPPNSTPPANLDYDRWTGPAPMRPFNSIMHPRDWRSFMEYGNGIIGDMGVHMLDMTRWMLGLGWPKRISSSGGILIDKASIANITDTQTASFDFGELTVNWQHRTWGRPIDPAYPWAATFYGDRGQLKASVDSWDFTPNSRRMVASAQHVPADQEANIDDSFIPDSEDVVAPAIRAHLRNFLAAVRDRTLPVADIAEGHISTATIILANNALKLGRTLTWDPVRGRVSGDEEANRLLQRAYRKGYVHPRPTV